jgi:hypothetical protein
MKTNEKLNLNNYWALSELIAKQNPDKILKSSEAGLSSELKQVVKRINDVYNSLRYLDTANLDKGHVFFNNLRMSILDFMRDNGYILARKPNGNGYFKRGVRK